MKHEETLRKLYEINKFVGFVAQNHKVWSFISISSSFSINILIMFSYSNNGVSSDDPNIKYARLEDPRLFFQESKSVTLQVILILGLLNLASLSLVASFFLIKRAPLLIKGIWKSFNPKFENYFSVLIIILQICYRAILSALALVNDFDFVYQVGYMFVGILGLSVHPFLYAVCLVEILRLDILKIVVKAFWNPIKEISFVIILFMIIQYYFSLFGYMVLYDEYEPHSCHDLWRCYVTDFD